MRNLLLLCVCIVPYGVLVLISQWDFWEGLTVAYASGLLVGIYITRNPKLSKFKNICKRGEKDDYPKG